MHDGLCWITCQVTVGYDSVPEHWPYRGAWTGQLAVLHVCMLVL